MSLWQLFFQQELAAWAMEGHALSFWWRDDDARRPTTALERLLALSARADVPVALAVIPAAENMDLAERIAGLQGITVVQHGIDHVNRATADEQGAREMATAWNAGEIVARIEATREFRRMPNWLPVFVPPWNDEHPCLETALEATGFTARSGGRRQCNASLVTIDAHLDILRWNGGARFRGERRFMRRLIRLARERRCAKRWKEPIGIVTHHLQHDEASWNFLEQFIPWTAGNSALMWRSVPALIEEQICWRVRPLDRECVPCPAKLQIPNAQIP